MKIAHKLLLILLTICFIAACNQKKENTIDDSKITEGFHAISIKEESIIDTIEENSAFEILNKPEIPILCYHRIEEGRDDIYSVSPTVFSSHIQILSDSGYNTILPDQIYNYLVYNETLPQKPIMITFDDSRKEHFTIAADELEKRNFRGVFFIMTVTNNKKNYMSTDEIKKLSERGHTIGLHSWDHVMVTKYNDSTTWQKQVFEPQEKLMNLIDKPIDYWAYPNGVYDRKAAATLHNHFKMSFILRAQRDSIYPLQTIRRMIIPSDSPTRLLRRIDKSF